MGNIKNLIERFGKTGFSVYVCIVEEGGITHRSNDNQSVNFLNQF